MVEDIFGILGTTLAGTFHVEEVIAEGGYGVVYRAEHVAFRAPVALKCLKIPGTISPEQSEQFVENFREEAEILFHLSAQIPEVVRPLHADAMTLDDGTFVPYIAMEWIDGKPLDSIVIMREDEGLKPLAVRKVVKMLAPIARALARAHHFQVPGGAVVSVTHCDLKPENIVITERDNPVRAKILDFGIAKARDTMRQNVGRITATEQARPFTPSYGAPEQWVPKRYGQSGPWTDVWGMALTLVECVTGNPPIDGEMHAMMGTALDRSRRPTPRNEGIEVSNEVERVFAQALAVDPRDRYTTVQEFWTDLEDAVGLSRTFRDEDERSSFDDLDDSQENGPPPRSEPPRASLSDAPASGEYELELDAASSHPPVSSSLPPPLAADVPSLEPRPLRSAPITSRRQTVQWGSEDEEPLGVVQDARPAPPSSSRMSSHSPSSRGFESGEFILEQEEPSTLSADAFDLDLTDPPPAPSTAAVSSSRQSGAHPAMSRSGVTPGSRPGTAGAKPQGIPRSLRSGAHASVSRTGANPIVAAPDEPSLGKRLKVPMTVIGIGLALTVVDMVLARIMGGTLSLGPIRMRWVAAAMVALGVVLAMVNLVGGSEEE